MRKVAWNSDMSMLGVPEKNMLVIYKWVEGQGYVKDKVIKEEPKKSKWCKDFLGILGKLGFRIFSEKKQLNIFIRLQANDFDWSPDCNHISLLAKDKLYALMDYH